MDYETILSTFDKRITLLQWLKQLTELLKDIKTEETVTADSVNPVESKGIYTFVMDNIAILRSALEFAIAGKQDVLMSGQNIKTVNGTSLLGAGDIQAGGANLYKHKISLSGSPAETSDNATLVFFSTSATPVTTVALFENILLNGILYFESPESSLYAENGGDVESFKIVSASNEGSYMLFNMTMNLMDGTGTQQEVNVNLAPIGDVVTQL